MASKAELYQRLVDRDKDLYEIYLDIGAIHHKIGDLLGVVREHVKEASAELAEEDD